MGHTLLCELGLFLLCTFPFNGHAEDAVLTTDPDWSTFFTGESVMFICDMKEGEVTDWEYKIKKDDKELISYNSHKMYTLQIRSTYDSGNYQCCGRKRSSYDTKCSNVLSLTVSGRPKATLTPGTTTISVGDTVRLTCSVERSDGWKYEWFSRTSDTKEVQLSTNDGQNKVISVSQGGIYRCLGVRGNPDFYTYSSDEVTIHITFLNKPVLRQQPDWSPAFSGETITLTCEVSGGESTECVIEWRRARSVVYRENNKYWTFITSESISGDYDCRRRLRDDSYSSTEWSEAITLSVSLGRPKATLTPGTTTISVGDTVRLTCSVARSDGWKYKWFRRTSDTKDVQLSTNDGQNKVISVSRGGIYRCRGGRGNPDFYTYLSDDVTIHITFLNKPVLRQQPYWSPTFSGEMITLTCEVSGGESTEWVYEWRRAQSVVHHENNKYWKFRASESISGDYGCRRRLRDDSYSSTDWSDSFSLMILKSPLSVLTVSPSWLSPGASVTLSCVVQHPSAGWRFYWYKALPDISDKFGSSIKELLPGSINGTAQDSYIVHGQRDTAGYLCRAGRGDPVYHTFYSNPKFVWSGDFNPSASLTVNADRAQHFTSDSVSLTCEGNSTEWRVRRFNDTSLLSYCSFWGTMKGSTCNVHEILFSTTVYWCESGSAFSNAVNITGQRDDIILVSPVHPATEGSSVILDCKLRTENVLSNVIFYKNDKIIQNDPRGQMIISAVSTTDEGFYKCQYSGKESPQSWMAVKSVSRAESSSSLFHVLLIVGLLCGISLIILLLLFCRYKQSKDSCFIRSQSTSQSSATDHMTNQDEAQRNKCAPPPHGDVSLYESIKSPEDAENDESNDVTYSLLEFKSITKKGKTKKPEESCVYSEVQLRSSPGKSAHAAADEMVYSEVKPGKSLDQ
ncbi:Fc receptor-like protein 5 [Embiotoca jacksoni]|uniref:Fc receptor-like protein 5 n=1 Tax=Embiotoca jacksoni TaxID=100190 RepID=UPI0037039579